MKTRHVLAAATLAMTGVAALPACAAPREDDLFEQAAQLYQQGRYSAAYARFATLADQRHADAARIALDMLRFGPQLYGTAWSAAPSQVRQWKQLAEGSGEWTFNFDPE